MVPPGLLILGAVREISELELLVSLPHNMTGTVAISNVSDPVTEKLEAEADMKEKEEEEEEEEEEEVRSTPQVLYSCMYMYPRTYIFIFVK